MFLGPGWLNELGSRIT